MHIEPLKQSNVLVLGEYKQELVYKFQLISLKTTRKGLMYNSDLS